MSDQVEHVLGQLPIHPDVTAESKWLGLRIDGLVSTSLDLSRDELAEISREKLTGDFRCMDGWVVPDLRWEGVPVAVLLERAGPLPEAAYVAFSTGGYTVGMTVADALGGNVIVALRLNGKSLSAEHGGPCRLIAQGQLCHFSVKWLDRIELMDDPPEETAVEIVTARKTRSSQP